MEIGQIYHFLFETYAGVGLFMLVIFIVSFILAAIFERKIRRKYVHRETDPNDYGFFEHAGEEN